MEQHTSDDGAHASASRKQRGDKPLLVTARYHRWREQIVHEMYLGEKYYVTVEYIFTIKFPDIVI